MDFDCFDLIVLFVRTLAALVNRWLYACFDDSWLFCSFFLLLVFRVFF
jgi:hypothetical protein